MSNNSLSGDRTDSPASEDNYAVIDIKSILDGLPDPAMMIDKKRKVVMYNSSFYDFFGIRPRHLPALLEESASLRNAIKALFDIENESVTDMSEKPFIKHVAGILYKCEDGNVYKGMRSYIPVITKENECCGVIIYYRDSTPEAKMQERYEKVLIEEKRYADDLEKKVSEKTEKLSQALKRVTLLSQTDSLTGLLNRQVFIEQTQKSIEIAKRYNEGLAILMLDLDHFKKVNDNYGHQAGDKVIQESTRIIKSLLRETDIMGKYGGEEFVVCVKACTISGVNKLCRRMLDSVESMSISDIVPGKTEPLTISVGCAIFPDHGIELTELIRCADEALYVAKNNGRNQFVIYTP
jgi:diguanylate cyclase (GGDEF)-like protein